MNDKTKQVASIGAAVVIGAAAALGGVAIFDEPTVVEKIEYINQTVEVPGEKVTVTETIEVEKIVEVDNGNLDLVLEYLEDNYGDELVFEDMRDIVENIQMEDEYKDKALDMFESEFRDEISYAYGYDYNEASLVKIRDETVKAIDYEDKEFVVSFEAEVLFENDDRKETRFYNVTYDFALDRDDVEDVEISVVRV